MTKYGKLGQTSSFVMTIQDKVRQLKAKHDNFSTCHDKVKKGKTKESKVRQRETRHGMSLLH